MVQERIFYVDGTKHKRELYAEDSGNLVRRQIFGEKGDVISDEYDEDGDGKTDFIKNLNQEK